MLGSGHISGGRGGGRQARVSASVGRRCEPNTKRLLLVSGSAQRDL